MHSLTHYLPAIQPQSVCWINGYQTIYYFQLPKKNLPVTAFILKRNEHFEIRWMTPELEINICGHGTLSAAYVVFQYLMPTMEKVIFKSSIESLEINRRNDDITLNFPEKLIEECHYDFLESALGVKPIETYCHQNERLMVVLPTETLIRDLKPDMSILKGINQRGITVTSIGDRVDFVSRTFYPKNELVKEDAVTGAAHCLLVPYWSRKLSKTHLNAKQLSRRTGEIQCEYVDNRILLTGRAVLYMNGEISV